MERTTKGWFNLTTAVKGTVVRRVAPRAMGYAVLGGVAAFAVTELGMPITVGPLGHSLLGIALGMLLVFRTDAAYDRYWEGRQRWSEIGASARNLMRAGSSYLATNNQMTTLVNAYVRALRYGLRGRVELREAQRLLSSEDQSALGAKAGNPLAIAGRMSARIREHLNAGDVSPDLAAELERYVAQLLEQQSACERIATSPMPLAYSAHIRHLLVVYLATLPFALVADFGWLVVPSMAVIAFGLIGIEEAAIEIEEPFGEDENDLPLDEFCENIRRDGKLLAEIGAAPATMSRRNRGALVSFEPGLR